MGLRIRTDLIALNAVRQLGLATANVAQTSRRLASGFRINSAADDPAGLVISERFRAQIDSLSRAQTNTADGIALTDTASAGLSEISNLLSEMRALAVSSSTGSLQGLTRAQIDSDFQDLKAEISAIANTTSFNNINPLNDSTLQVDIQVGTEAGSANQITISGVDATASAITIDALAVSSQSGAGAALNAIDSAIDSVSALAARFGAASNRLSARSRLLGAEIEATSSAQSVIRDADIAIESANLARFQVLQESALAILTQANTRHALLLRLLPS